MMFAEFLNQKANSPNDEAHISQRLFESLPIGLAVCDMDGTMVCVNSAFASIMGYSIEDVMELSYWDVTPIEYEAQEGDQLISLQNTGRYGPYEKEYIHKAGHRIPVRLSGVIIQNNNQDYIWSSVEDITERKNFERSLQRTRDELEARVIERTKELRASEARLENILKLAPEAVIIADRDRNIRLFNYGAERIFGHRANDVIGQSVDILMPARFHSQHEKHVQRFEESSEDYSLMDERDEIAGLRKDGTEFPASASVSKLEFGGEPLFTVMLQDISERRQADEERRNALVEAEQANQAKSEFLATMSHEFRTPLNAILGFSEMLRAQYFGPLGAENYKGYADDIYYSGQHMLGLVNDVLDISAIEAGKRVMSKKELNINELLEDCVRNVKNAADRSGIYLTLEIPDTSPPLYADQKSATQVVFNLLSNAIKFTKRHGEIEVSTNVSDGNTMIVIADTGIGIPADKLPTITESFAQANTNPHNTQEGTGLGLAIVKSLVETQGGKLSIESELGKGTTVTVAFPPR